MSGPKRLRCSFCNKTQDEVVKLIAGPDVYICNECIDLCNEIMSEENETMSEAKNTEQDSTEYQSDIPTQIKKPRTIYEQLSAYIIGQEYAKKVISVAVYKHYRRIITPANSITHAVKENILLIGPTGTGKTFIAKTLAKILEVPVGISDATALTEAGYVGEDVESVLAYLYKAAGYNIKRAEKGIVYIDEIDKITRKQSNLSITRDVSGEGVQHGLLTMLGGGVLRFDSKNKRKHPGAEFVEMNTDDILFICGGSFEGIEHIVLERLKKLNSSSAKLPLNSNELRAQITQADLFEFGFAPEFAARFTAIVPLSTLEEDDFVRILNESQDSLIKHYEIFFAAENINISFTENAIKAIAKKAVQDKTGVRGLRSVLDKALLDVLFEIPTRQDIRECIVGPEVIEKSSPPILINQVGKPVVLKRNQIFISYSQKDLVWLDEFKTILSPMMRNKTIDIWFDRKIKPSQEWRKEIESALAATKVAVLLVSPNFLASDFVMSEEFPYLLNVAHTENVKLLWVLLGSCLYEETPLKDYQAVHNISKPLDSLSESERREVWVMISKHVKEAANAPLGAI